MSSSPPSRHLCILMSFLLNLKKRNAWMYLRGVGFSKHAVDGVSRVQLFVIDEAATAVAERPRPLCYFHGYKQRTIQRGLHLELVRLKMGNGAIGRVVDDGYAAGLNFS